MMKKTERIYVAGHTGLAGSSVLRLLKKQGYKNIIAPTKRPDLRSLPETLKFFIENKPKYVVMAAAHAGGILEAVNNPASMLFDNLTMQTNVIEACSITNVEKLINLGSSCMYPVDVTQPYREEHIGHGKTDENWSYAVAKLCGLEMCRSYYKQFGCNFMTVLPCNLYGIEDNFDLETAHVIPALIRKFHEGEKVEVWGFEPGRVYQHYKDGGGYYSPMREFLWSDDFAKAVVMLLESYNYTDLHEGVINIGYGHDHEIKHIVYLLREIIGEREIVWNPGKPAGVKSKLLDISRIKALGWKPEIDLKTGLEMLNKWYIEKRLDGYEWG